MVNVKSNGGITELETGGTLSELYADVMSIIHYVYKAIAETDEGMADIFSQRIIDDIDMCFMSDEEIVKRAMSEAIGIEVGGNEDIGLKS